MDKLEIFTLILNTCADVCYVSVEDVMNGAKKESVVTARALCIFWTDAAGFSVESLTQLTKSSHAASINSIKSKQEDFWCHRFAYHMLVIEVGKRLLDAAHEIGEDFDMWVPIRRIAKSTGKYNNAIPKTN